MHRGIIHNEDDNSQFIIDVLKPCADKEECQRAIGWRDHVVQRRSGHELLWGKVEVQEQLDGSTRNSHLLEIFAKT